MKFVKIVLIGAALVACGTYVYQTELAPKISIEIENRNYYDANVRVFAGGRQLRKVFVVGMGTSQTIRITDPQRPIHFTVDFVGSREIHRSEEIMPHPQGSIKFTVGVRPDMSVLTQH